MLQLAKYKQAEGCDQPGDSGVWTDLLGSSKASWKDRAREAARVDRQQYLQVIRGNTYGVGLNQLEEEFDTDLESPLLTDDRVLSVLEELREQLRQPTLGVGDDWVAQEMARLKKLDTLIQGLMGAMRAAGMLKED